MVKVKNWCAWTGGWWGLPPFPEMMAEPCRNEWCGYKSWLEAPTPIILYLFRLHRVVCCCIRSRSAFESCRATSFWGTESLSYILRQPPLDVLWGMEVHFAPALYDALACRMLLGRKLGIKHPPKCSTLFVFSDVCWLLIVNCEKMI